MKHPPAKLDWDKQNVDHIWKHRVIPEEVREVLYDDENIFIKRVGRNRFRAIGKTQGGRFLTIFYDLIESNLGRVVTTREPKDYEKKLYRELHSGS